MQPYAVKATGLTKHYQILQREPGLRGAIKALFRRTYRTKEAVKAIDLTIEAGERVGYIGFNGAGKSTTVQMLTTLIKLRIPIRTSRKRLNPFIFHLSFLSLNCLFLDVREITNTMNNM